MGLPYHQKVRNGYLEIAKQNPRRCTVVDYRPGNINGTHEEIFELVKNRLRL